MSEPSDSLRIDHSRMVPHGGELPLEPPAIQREVAFCLRIV